MYFKFVCPSCSKTLKVREEHIGKRSRCPYCRSSVTITAPPVEEETAGEADSLTELAAAVQSGRGGQGRAQVVSPDPIPVAKVRTATPVETPESAPPESAKALGNDVTQLLSFAIGLGFALLLYALLFLLARKSYLGELFIERGWVPYVLAVLLGWSGGILTLKWFSLRRQKDSMLFDVLPTSIAEEITVQNTAQFVEQIREFPSDTRQSFLINRVRRGLEHFRVRRNTQEVANVLSSQSDIDATSVQSSYTILKVFIWAIPILGFIGTVIGIGDSIGSFTGAMDNAEDVAKLKESLSGVTSGLATAFDTTLIALVMSLLVMFPTSSMQKAEEDLLNWVDEYCNENLLKRLKDAGDHGPEQGGLTSREVRAAVDSALSRHHAEIAAWSSHIEQTAGQVTELHLNYLERLRKLSEAVDQQEGAVNETLGKAAMDAATRMAQVGEALTALNKVLGELDGKHVVIEQHKRGWFGRSPKKSKDDGEA